MSTNAEIVSRLVVVVIGAYLLTHGHPVAGGWTLALGLLSLC